MIINVVLHGILAFLALVVLTNTGSTSHGIPALNDDEIELRIKRDLPVS